MALPLIPILLLGGGAILVALGRRAEGAPPVVTTTERLHRGQLAFQGKRFGGLIAAAQSRGNLRADGPALGSGNGWALQPVKRDSDGEKQLLFANPRGNQHFLVRGGFLSYYDEFAERLGRPVTDEYERRTSFYNQIAGAAGVKSRVITQDFLNGRMDWVPTTKEVYVYSGGKKIGGWRRNTRINSYHFWDMRGPLAKGVMKLEADLTSVAAIGAGGAICISGSIFTAGAGSVEFCKLGAKVAALSCDVNQGLQKLGEKITEGQHAKNRIDYPDEGYVFNQKDVCNVTRVIDTVANGPSPTSAVGAGLAGVVMTEENF